MPTALIADDEPHLASYLRDALARAWPELEIVHVARNGAEAAERIAAQRAHMQSFVDRFRAKATKARQAQARIKALEKLPADRFENAKEFGERLADTRGAFANTTIGAAATKTATGALASRAVLVGAVAVTVASLGVAAFAWRRASNTTPEPVVALALDVPNARPDLARFAVSGDGAVRKPAQPHYQSRDFNTLNGGIARWFDPVTDGAADSAAFQAILRICHTLFDGLTPAPAWHVEAHQFRITAHPGQLGQPTPEGMHQDGVDWVLVEGFKHAALPKIEIWRAEVGKPAQYLSDPHIVAIATDDFSALPAPSDLPLLDLSNPDAVVDYLLQHQAKFAYASPSDSLPLGVAGDSDMSDPSELPVAVVKSDFPFK